GGDDPSELGLSQVRQHQVVEHAGRHRVAGTQEVQGVAVTLSVTLSSHRPPFRAARWGPIESRVRPAEDLSRFPCPAGPEPGAAARPPPPPNTPPPRRSGGGAALPTRPAGESPGPPAAAGPGPRRSE